MVLAGDCIWEVPDLGKRYLVNLKNKTCSCRAWDLAGIPCIHTYLVVIHREDDVENYVSEFYSVKRYKRAYRHRIIPFLNQSQWPSEFK